MFLKKIYFDEAYWNGVLLPALKWTFFNFLMPAAILKQQGKIVDKSLGVIEVSTI